MQVITGGIVVLIGVYLIGLGVATWLRPELSRRWFEAFASTARAHYIEQLIRFVVALALIDYAAHMLYPEVYALIGWVILITTIGLILIPWRWHHRFAAKVVPMVVRFAYFYTGVGLLLGFFIIYCVFQPYLPMLNTP